ncbi:MAG: hypothetical protein WB798_03130 [Nocardioidaceae bacterium]
MTAFPAAPATGRAAERLTRLNKSGLVLALLLGLADIGAVFNPTPDGEVGPPMAILVLDSVLGLVTVAGVGYALARRSRGAVRIVAAARVVSAVTALPAFFVGVPAWLEAMVGVFVLLTVASVVMMLAPARRTDRIVD